MGFLKNIFGGKNAPVKSYEDFWAWFQKNEKTFYKVVKDKGNITKDFFDKLSPKLDELRDGLFYLTGMFDKNTVELVITPDGALKNFVFAEELVAAAPEIAGWKFTALKPAMDTSATIGMAGYNFGSNNITFYSNEHADFPDEIDITFVYDGFNKENEKTVINGTYIFLENFLGELNFAETIDSSKVIGKESAEKELIAVEKLKDFLFWRQKEFVEKYEGVRYNTDNDVYATYDAKHKNGAPLVAMMNNSLLQWDSKASHPWIMKVGIKYKGDNNNGMPDKKTYDVLGQIEDEVLQILKDSEGYLNIGRQTGNNCRDIYFACRDFRKPSKILYNIQCKYKGKVDIGYDIYKDKYWQSFERFMGSEVVD